MSDDLHVQKRQRSFTFQFHCEFKVSMEAIRHLKESVNIRLLHCSYDVVDITSKDLSSFGDLRRASTEPVLSTMCTFSKSESSFSVNFVAPPRCAARILTRCFRFSSVSHFVDLFDSSSLFKLARFAAVRVGGPKNVSFKNLFKSFEQNFCNKREH